MSRVAKPSWSVQRVTIDLTQKMRDYLVDVAAGLVECDVPMAAAVELECHIQRAIERQRENMCEVIGPRLLRAAEAVEAEVSSSLRSPVSSL